MARTVKCPGCGITPAWAGKSQRCWAAHRPAEGSPPRGRGKDVTLKTSSEKPGITPAWAGKSDIYETLGTDPEDHPRVGGEKCGQCVVVVGVKGSPPRGRGKADHISGHNLCARITPAWAGKSGISHAYRPRPRDHPRVGGEKQMQEQAGKYWVGSPPRGRGKAIKDAGERQAARITPAWAGKRPCQERPVEGRRDHPRVGGEKITGGRCLPVSRGSPPRGRGKAAPHGFLAEVDGDHPRVGGEKQI